MKKENIHWRLLINSPHDGIWNMALDESILETVARKEVLPTLRLYAWNPYCLSLGQAQSILDVDQQRLINNNWGIVRRPTGGKAILHADELTYSICLPQSDPLVSGTVVESYRRLSTALLLALQNMGIKADSKPKSNEERKKIPNPVCFEVPSDYEITYHEKKLIGSAQARRAKGVLQHGAIPLFGNITRITNVLKFQDETQRQETASKLFERATTIQSILNRTISWQEIADAVIEGFEKTLNIYFSDSKLSVLELKRAEDLVRNKYGNKEWTYKQ